MAAPARSASSARSTARAPKRLGCEEPRVFTPPLRKLTPKTSLGFAVVQFADEVVGIDLFPWQKWLLIHALELLPDGSFRFRNVVVLVARQNGKSTLSQVLSLFFLYVLGTALVIGTAQDLDVAEEIWQGAVDIVEETPELDSLKERVVKVNGKKSLELKSGERYKVKAANRRAGRGLSGDLILLDELREHQSWDAWGAITKTTMARPNAQVWALSNAGDATSVVLRYLRKMAHAELGDPDGINGNDDPASLLVNDDDLEPDELEVEDDGSLGLFEWSAPPGCSVLDRDGWAQANPSLGYSITERTIASAARTDPEWVFRTEVLCQWSDGSLEGPFPPGSWEAGQDAESRRAPDAEVVACVDVSHDRGMAHIAIAARREDGKIHTEVVASRAGVEWVKPWLTDEAFPHRAKWRITGQTNGAPVSSLLPDLEAAGLPVEPWQGPDLARWSGAFYDLVRGLGEDGSNTPGVYHRPQPVLDVPASTAVTKPLGDGWVWDRRHSPTDIAPLVACTGAVGLLTRPVEGPKRSKYEDADLVVL
ncbi:MAG TPA: terminase large subunit [Pedococcus sp.]|nr:terminase large subunit [Pedococcus sp.]